MSHKYKFYDSSLPYFVSFATVNWVDLFTRREYSDVLVRSLEYCIKHKGMILNAWCIMPSHVHLILRSETAELSDIMRDFKKYTSKKLIDSIKKHPQESRKEWLLWMFKKAGRENNNNQTYQLWQQHNHPIELSTNKMLDQRLEYLHMNPVKAGYVQQPERWMFSSARSYAGLERVIEIEYIR